MLEKLATVNQKLSPNLRKVIGNTAWLFADRILRMVIGLIVGLWVARYLGPEQFGLYNYAIAFVALWGTFATLGLDSIVVRDIVREPSCRDETLGTAFVLKFLGGIAILLLTTGTISLLRPNDNLAYWLVAIIAAGTVFQAFDTTDFWFQSQVQSKYSVYGKTTAYLVVNLIKVALIQMHAPLIAFAWAALAEIALGAVGVVVAYRVKGQHLRAWRFSFFRAKALLKQSWPLIFSGIVIMIYMRIDQLMLGMLIGDKAVGIYSAAVKVSELWYFVPGAIVNSVFPSIIEAKTISENLYYERLQKVLNLMSILSYAIAIPVTLFSSKIITLLYDESYLEAGPILATHVWAGVFVSLGVTRSSWIIAEGLMKFSFATTAAGAVINVILNLFLINRYGGMGAAVATVIAQFFASYGANAFYPKTKRIFIAQTKSLLMIDLIKKSRLIYKSN